jgi:hypothetical protein
VPNRKQVINRELALARLREAVPGTLDREVEHAWVVATREAGAGEIEQAVAADPRRKLPE